METNKNKEILEHFSIVGEAFCDFSPETPLINVQEINFNTQELIMKDKTKFFFKKESEFKKIIKYFKNQKNDSEENSNLENILKTNKNSLQFFLKKILLESSNIDEFLRKSIALKELKNFKTTFLFIHKKGEEIALRHEVNRDAIFNDIISVKDFNSLFKSIKKSKNRSFGQNELKDYKLNILGTFIGREFSLTDHNIIFILSRNDFLSPTESELETFRNLCTPLPFFLNLFLKNMASSLKINIEHYIKNNLLENKLIPSKTGNLEILHSERISLLGELLNTLKHELSNPIFGLQLSLNLLKEEKEWDEDTKIFLEEASQNTTRSQNIIKTFSDLFLEKDLKKRINLKDSIEEVLKLTKSETKGIKKIVMGDPKIEILINSTLFVQVIFNLVINSAQELQEAKVKDPKITINLSQKGNYIYLEIKDNGRGIDPKNISEIFNPFYTTKEKGTGLGLPITKNIVEKMGGEIYCQESDSGAQFNIKLKERDNE